MRRFPVSMAAVLALAALAALGAQGKGAQEEKKKAEPAERAWGFDQDQEGAPAKGFRAAVGEWKVEADPEAASKPRVLAQTAKSASTVYNVALVEGTAYRDLDLQVKLKSVAGEVDQGGGLVWRAKDAKNYYIARYNPIEGNFRLYKVVEGKRTQLATAEAANTGGWRTLRVAMKGDSMECSLDGKKLLEAKDSAIKEPGMLGLWTKADAQTRFDDLKVKGD